MLASCAYRGVRCTLSQRPVVSFLSGSPFPTGPRRSDDDKNDGAARLPSSSSSRSHYSTIPAASSSSVLAIATTLSHAGMSDNNNHQQHTIRTILSSSSFSSLPPEEEATEKSRVESLTPYQKEMELRQLDAELAKLQTLRAINTGELYTLRGKFKMLSRDYGMGFLAWYWTVWFGTAGLSYLAIEMGGVDPMMVAAKAESFLGWEPMSISGRIDPTIGQIGLVVAFNECLEPLRLPFVVVTTKPVVNFFSRS